MSGDIPYHVFVDIIPVSVCKAISHPDCQTKTFEFVELLRIQLANLSRGDPGFINKRSTALLIMMSSAKSARERPATASVM